MTIKADCTIACTATPECTVCHRTKALRGRDYPAAMGGGYCDWDCPGYDQPPLSGHLWPSEWHEREAEQADARWLTAVERLRKLEADPDAYIATTDGGWPRVGWGRVLQVGMYDGWPYWRPYPSVQLSGTLGPEWHSYTSITDIELRRPSASPPPSTPETKE